MKPLLYDVCCKPGGATKGYQRAGFRVVGIDKDPQPRYVGDGFIQMDAIEFMRRYLAGEYEEAQAFAGSPPCQFATDATLVWRAQGKTYPNLIPALRDAFVTTGLPYAIENVPGAAGWLENPVVLNGGMFGLNVHRVRLFECNFPVPFPLLPPMPRPVKMGRPVKAGEIIQPVGHFSNTAYAREQMGIDWMIQEELAEAIPPAFTEWIGGYMMQAVLEVA